MEIFESLTIEGDLDALVEEIESGKALQHWVELSANKEKVLNRMEEIYRHSWPVSTQPSQSLQDLEWAPENSRWPTFKEKLRDLCQRFGWQPQAHPRIEAASSISDIR